MAQDVTFIISAKDSSSAVFQQVKQAGVDAAGGIASAFNTVVEKLQVIPEKIRKIDFKGLNDNINSGLDTALKGSEVVKAWDETLKTIETRVAIWGIAIVTGISAVLLGAAYAAYKSIGFVVGLFTGESYKSKSIDAVIAINNEVKDLQKQLQLTAVDANALSDALTRMGVNKSDVVTVYQNSEKAIRANKEELDRLGVAYKDVNGKMLPTYELITNAKKKLDEYTAGWDRNQAATAMALGSYEQMTNYLKVNQGELQKSKTRLDEYNLGMGTDAQKAIGAYQAAMLDFNNEVKLMGQGFSRAWSDQIMPALTATAVFLKDGWPIIVNAFRYGLAQLTSLGYGLKMVFDIITETTIGSLSALGSIIMGVGRASAQVLRGDFAGAQQSLVNGWEQAKTRIGVIGDNLVKKANENMAAMKLAWGFDSRSAGNNFLPDKAGKPWVAAPAKPDEEDALKLWTDKAKAIISIEKERIETLLTMEREYLGKLKTEFEGHVKTLETFEAAFMKVKDSIAARNKKDVDANAAAMRGAEDEYQKYYRQLSESKSRELAVDEDRSFSAASQAKKLEAYNAELELITKVRDESKAANIATISEYQIEADYQLNKARLEEKILSLGNQEVEKLTDIAVKSAEAMNIMERGIKAQELQVKILDDMIKNIPNLTEKTITLKINGIQDLYKISELMTGRGATAVLNPVDPASSYSEINGRYVWGNGTDAGPIEARAAGGPVLPYATYRINETGTEYLTMGSKGGYVTPAGQGPGGKDAAPLTITGGISISLPSITKVGEQEADQIARAVYSRIKQFDRRYA